jgi:Icc-related predicted phosphoesterase
MRIVCISDTHNKHKEIDLPEGDILIHAGDFTNRGTFEEVVTFSNWLAEIKDRYKKIFVIAGNHDFFMERQPALGKNILKDHCEYLFDSEYIYEGIKFYGAPWQPTYFNWAFNVNRGTALAAKWVLIPEDVHVLITHTPVWEILDKNKNGDSCGCKDLLDRLDYLDRLKLHVGAHIHESHGILQQNNKIFVNASICTINHEPINTPIIVEL